MKIRLMLFIMLFMTACGIDITNNNTNASDGGQVSTGVSGNSSVDACNVEWEYTTNSRSGITILSVVGADQGTYSGTCSDGTAIEGTFVEGDEIDPCVSDKSNRSIFALDCGWSETVEFDS